MKSSPRRATLRLAAVGWPLLTGCVQEQVVDPSPETAGDAATARNDARRAEAAGGTGGSAGAGGAGGGAGGAAGEGGAGGVGGAGPADGARADSAPLDAGASNAKPDASSGGGDGPGMVDADNCILAYNGESRPKKYIWKNRDISFAAEATGEASSPPTAGKFVVNGSFAEWGINWGNLDVQGRTHVVFKMKIEGSPSSYLGITVRDGMAVYARPDGNIDLHLKTFSPTWNAPGWKDIAAPLKTFGSPAVLQELTFKNRASGNYTVYVDDIRFCTPR